MHLGETSQQERASKIRFKQQIFASIGGGMIFALVGVVTTALLTMGSGFLTMALGIGAVATLGLSCVYLAAKNLSKAVNMDQETQAEKISAATKGKGVDLTPKIENSKPATGMPYGMGVSPSEEKSEPQLSGETPTTKLTDVAYQNKLAASHGEKITLH